MNEKIHFSSDNYALKVHKSFGQKRIEQFKKENIFDESRWVIREKEFIWIPIKKQIKESKKKDLPLKNPFPYLKEKYAIRSFDIIGEIIVLFIPNNLETKKQEIGNFLLRSYPHVKAVYCETGKASGEFRVQPRELIAGEGSETIHFENKLKFKLDITKVFFSPRQISERVTLTKLFTHKEKVCVFFSGIAPIPIYLSKFTEASEIIGIELNPIAHKYGLENLRLNNINNVKLINGDIEEIIPEIIKKELFDLVVLPTPRGAENFIQLARKTLKLKGKLVSYNTCTSTKLEEKLEEIKTTGFQIEEIKKGAEIAPNEFRYRIICNKIN